MLWTRLIQKHFNFSIGNCWSLSAKKVIISGFVAWNQCILLYLLTLRHCMQCSGEKQCCNVLITLNQSLNPLNVFDKSLWTSDKGSIVAQACRKCTDRNLFFYGNFLDTQQIWLHNDIFIEFFLYPFFVSHKRFLLSLQFSLQPFIFYHFHSVSLPSTVSSSKRRAQKSAVLRVVR